jgi:hypothetical protein
MTCLRKRPNIKIQTQTGAKAIAQTLTRDYKTSCHFWGVRQQ